MKDDERCFCGGELHLRPPRENPPKLPPRIRIEGWICEDCGTIEVRVVKDDPPKQSFPGLID